jgi:hypothetical protein
MELASDGLGGQQSTLADKQSSTFIKCGARQHDLLCTVFEHLPLALFQEAEEKAHCAGAEGLKQLSHMPHNQYWRLTRQMAVIRLMFLPLPEPL